eukprot:CAMPEP_0178911166 /NCGR_PEP_ID=MMETSP0786-20121207/9531_1 /TAXON_ID=186022 /ORGANISM="Thalassionema frauenfeldii, Strain CCMP 1798" /LENGTH=377 /DNA_ID=CAMNT_0020583557 /DNA_START=281 /DNA_END=1414 /DNA_ORIENTATION=-
MCLQKDCEIATHAERPYPTCFTSGDVVLIQAPNGHEAFLKPAVYAGKLQPNLERYLQEERSKESWESLLTNLDKTENVTSEEMANFENRIDTREREYPLGVTPLKKRVKLDLNSPTLDAGFEVTVLDLVDDLGANDSMVLSNLREQWRLLGQNLRTLKELQEGAREGLRNLSSASAEEFARVNLESSRLDNKLGERNEDAGTMAAFNMIAMLWEERSSQDKLEEDAQAKGPTWEAEIARRCSEAAKRGLVVTGASLGKGGFLGYLKAELNLVFQLFMKTSSTPNTPGDILESRLSDLDQKIADLRRMVNSGSSRTQGSGATGGSGAGATGTGSLWAVVGSTGSGTSSSNTIPPNVTTSEFNKSLNRILGLENAVNDL